MKFRHKAKSEEDREKSAKADHEVGKFLQLLHETNFPLEILFLGPLKFAVLGIQLRVDSAHVAVPRPRPRVALAHQRQAVLIGVKHPPLRRQRQGAILHEPDECSCGVEVKSLSGWIVLALVMNDGQLPQEHAVQAAETQGLGLVLSAP